MTTLSLQTLPLKDSKFGYYFIRVRVYLRQQSTVRQSVTSRTHRKTRFTCKTPNFHLFKKKGESNKYFVSITLLCCGDAARKVCVKFWYTYLTIALTLHLLALLFRDSPKKILCMIFRNQEINHQFTRKYVFANTRRG